MSADWQDLRALILEQCLQLDLLLPNSPIARLVTYRARQLFLNGGVDETTGELTEHAEHEMQLLMDVMREQITHLLGNDG